MVDECIEIIHKNQVFFHFDFSKTFFKCSLKMKGIFPESLYPSAVISIVKFIACRL